MGTILVIGIAIGFNFIILKWKYDHGRYNDLAMDVIVLVTLAMLFGDTILGMASAMVGGMLVSIYLLLAHKEQAIDYSPPKSQSNSQLRW